MSTSLGVVDKHQNTSILSHADFFSNCVGRTKKKNENEEADFFSNCVGRRTKKNENEEQNKKQK
jgi:hypothetical protein